MTIPATGTQHEIVFQNLRATVTEVGATLRSFQVDGVDVVTTFSEESLPTGCQGQQLLPWPNRIRDGRYDWDGQVQQLPVNEVDRNNAVHGLLNCAPWRIAELYPSAVRMQANLFPQPGWPGVLAADLTHWLDPAGLNVELRVTNQGSTPFPFGYAAHPYLTLGQPIDELDVTVPFTHYLATDDRLLPDRLFPQPSDDLSGGLLGARELDTAFRGAKRGDDGTWSVRVSNAERSVELWADQHFDWLQIYTPQDRASIAVEPMTCGPNAFNEGPTHDSLLVLSPGEVFTCQWGIRAS